MKNEEYVADFYLVTRRTLSEEEHRIFRYHYLLGADWRLCCLRLRMDRGAFFHSIYRVEEKLGRVFRELEPFSLYPLDEYFGNRIEKHRPALAFTPIPDKRVLRPPVLKIA